MSYKFRKLSSAAIPIFENFLPPRTRPTKGKAKHRPSTPHQKGAPHHQSLPCRTNATGTTGTDPKWPPRPNTSNSRTGRPLRGEDDSQPAKPTKHSAGNNATTSHADTPQRATTKHARRETNGVGDGLQLPVGPVQAIAQPRTSPPMAATTSANQHNAPGMPRSQHNHRHIGQAGRNKPRK